jgi:uncharacterized protein (DUF2225 family)/FtsZ-binding cell division protein ZapB
MTEEKNVPKEDPFIRYDITCPICGEINKQMRIKSRMCWERDRDIDLQPRQFYWIKKNIRKVHPPLYYMWVCPSCMFAAANKFFTEPVKDSSISLEKFRAQYLKFSKEDYHAIFVLKALGADLDFEQMTFLQAIKSHLLAIFILEQYDSIREKDAMNLGRYTLRLAWLYRDLENAEDELEDTMNGVREMTASVKEYWPHMLDSEEKALHRAVEYYNTAFDKSTVLRTVKDEVNVLQLIARIHIKLGEYHDALRLLQMSIDKARREKQRLDEELRIPRREGEELTAEKSGKMVSDSRRFSNLADTGQSLFEKVRQEWFKAHAEKGRKIMAEHPGAPPEEMRQHLQAANIDRRVIDRIAPEPKKKGLFGIFK